MIVHKIVVGSLRANCYIVADEETKQAIIIDPGDEADRIIDVINKNNLKPKSIILTHAHFDHVGALEELQKEFSLPKVKLLDTECLTVIETPGHTADGVCIVDEDSGVIFTGDTLFKNSIGRTDLPGGNPAQMKESLERLMQFPDNFKIYPGHGDESTIGEERQHNPFLQN